MRAFKAALEKGKFDRAYYFHGDDDFLKEEQVRALIARATETPTRDFNLDQLRAPVLDAGALALVLQSLPLMAERRMVVIRDAGTLTKDIRATLSAYLAHASPQTVLLLVAPALGKPDVSLLDLTSSLEFKRLNEEDLSKFVARRVAAIGSTITPGAITLLCSATENDLLLLTGEIDKLRSFTNGAEITESDVTAVVGIRHGETLGDLLDAVAMRDAPAAIALLDEVLSLPKTSGVPIVMALTTQTLAIGWAVAAIARGLSPYRVEQELFGLLKENSSSLVGRSWGEGVKCWARAVRLWNEQSVDRALALLLAADKALKDTRTSSDWQLLATMFLAMTADVTRRAAA